MGQCPSLGRLGDISFLEFSLFWPLPFTSVEKRARIVYPRPYQ